MSPNWLDEDNIERDRGWGVQAFQGADEITPAKFKLIKTRLIDPGLICLSGGNLYVFLTHMNIWSVLCSHQSLVFINNLIGNENASVKYANAASPVVPMIEKNSVDFIAKEIPQSICIGSERLRVSLVNGELRLSRCDELLVYPGKDKEILSALCYMPIYIRFWPKKWKKTPSFPLYKVVAPLFVKDIELKTLEWCLGHAFIDPHSYSKTVILYGEGGHGKSTIMTVINSIFFGCCSTIPDTALENLRGGVSVEVASIVASNRIVTAGDVGGAGRNTNLTVVKSLTGHDYMSIPPSRVKTACTLVYATNTLDDPFSNIEWCTAAIMRRVVVILINSNIIEGFSPNITYDPSSRLDFALRCTHTRLSNPYMPVNAMSVLLTIMGSRIDLVTSRICESEYDEAYDEEMIEANCIVAAAMALNVSELGELASRISNYCIIKISGIKYIKNIVTKSSIL